MGSKQLFLLEEQSKSQMHQQNMSHHTVERRAGGGGMGGLTGLIRDPLHLKLLILAGTELNANELPQITACCNLMKLDISSNSLDSIPITMDFGRFTNLKLLYLHNNRLADMESLASVFRCQQLTYLTIFRNPIAELASIRHYVINSIPSLKCLDFDFVRDSERDSKLRVHRQYFTVKSKLNWPLMVYPNDENLTEAAFLQILHREIQLVTATHASCSYVLTIQRFVRGFLVRRRVLRVLTHAHNKENSIIKFAAKWKQYVVRRRDLKSLLNERRKLYLLEDTKVYRHMTAMNKLGKIVREFNERLRQKKQSQRAVRMVVRVLKSRILFFMAFQNYFKLCYKTIPKTLYVRRDQIHLFDSLEFKKIMVNQASASMKDRVAQFCENMRSSQTMKHAHAYQVFRLPETMSKDMEGNPLVSLVKPSAMCKVILRKGSEKNKNAIYYFGDKFKHHPVLSHIENMQEFKRRKAKKLFTLDPHDKHRVKERVKRIKRFQDDAQDSLVQICFEHQKILSYFLRTVVHMNSIAEMKNQQIEAQQQQVQEPIKKQTKHEQVNLSIDEQNEYGLSQNHEKQYIDYYQQQLTSIHSESRLSSEPAATVAQIQSRSKKQEKLLVFFDLELQRVSSAMKIQQVWRQYVLKKLMQKAKMNPFKQLAAHHSVTRIQRWARQLGYAHKSNFMKQIYHYMQSLVVYSSKTLLIHEEVYLNLFDYVVRSSTYYPFRSAATQLFAFREARADILFNKSVERVMLRNIEYNILPRVFPQFIEDMCVDEKRSFKVQNEQVSSSSSSSGWVEGDIYHVLHLGAKVARVTVDQMNYVSFTFQSLEDALYRTAMLALKTFNFRMNGSFVLLMPMQLVTDLKFTVGYEDKLSVGFRRPIVQKEGKGRGVNNLKPIENKLALFVASETQSELTLMKSHHVGASKNIHMFSKSMNNKHPTKIITSLRYCLFDQLNCNAAEKETTSTAAKNNNSPGGDFMNRQRLPQMRQQQQQQQQQQQYQSQNYANMDNTMYSVYDESKSEVLLAPKYLQPEKNNNENAGVVQYAKKNGFSTAPHSRNNSIGVSSAAAAAAAQYYGQSQQPYHLSSQCSTGANNGSSPMNFYVDTKESMQSRRATALLKQQDMQFAMSMPTPDEQDFSTDFPSAEAVEKFLSYRQSGLSFGRPSRSNSNSNSIMVSRGAATAGVMGGGAAAVKYSHDDSMDFNDPRNVKQAIRERERSAQEQLRRLVEEEKGRRMHVKEMNLRLQEAQAFERVTHVKAMRQNIEVQREGEQRQDIIMKTQQMLRIKQPKVIAGSAEDAKVENTMMKNVNFLSKQITQFQRKKHALELQEKQRVRIQMIKEEKATFVAGQLHPVQQYEVLKNKDVSVQFLQASHSAASSATQRNSGADGKFGLRQQPQQSSNEVTKSMKKQTRGQSVGGLSSSSSGAEQEIEGIQSRGGVGGGYKKRPSQRLPLIEQSKNMVQDDSLIMSGGNQQQHGHSSAMTEAMVSKSMQKASRATTVNRIGSSISGENDHPIGYTNQRMMKTQQVIYDIREVQN